MQGGHDLTGVQAAVVPNLTQLAIHVGDADDDDGDAPAADCDAPAADCDALSLGGSDGPHIYRDEAVAQGDDRPEEQVLVNGLPAQQPELATAFSVDSELGHLDKLVPDDTVSDLMAAKLAGQSLCNSPGRKRRSSPGGRLKFSIMR